MVSSTKSTRPSFMGIRAAALALLAFSSTGCLSLLFPGSESNAPVRGYLYTDVSFPLSKNHKAQSAGSMRGGSDVKRIREPFTGADIRAVWDSNAIGDIAKQHGIAEIYSADLHIFSVLFGIWSQYEIVVVGAPALEERKP